MFATIELQKHAVADRYYHQLHPKPWAKSPEEGPGQECFLPPRGGINLRCTQSPAKDSGLRWRGERYIPKNVFFLREEVLIYDAPIPRKDNRFDQEPPSIRG